MQSLWQTSNASAHSSPSPSPATPRQRGSNMGEDAGDERTGRDVGSRSSALQGCMRLGGAALLTFVGLRMVRRVVRHIFKDRVRRRRESNSSSSTGAQLPSARMPSGAINLGSEDTWRVVDAPSPPIPDEYKEIAQDELPYSVQDFFTKVISSKSGFMEFMHVQVDKHYNWAPRGWRSAPSSPSLYPYSDDKSFLVGLEKSVFEFTLGASGSGGFVRTITYSNPKRAPAPVDSDCVERQQFVIYRGSVILFATSMNTLNTPYNDCFMVNTLWEVRPVTSTSCLVTIYLKVHFLKTVLVAPLIRATTFRDTTDFYKKFLTHAREKSSGAIPPPGAPSGSRAVAAPGPSPPPSQAAASEAPKLSLLRQLRVWLMLALLLTGLVHQWMLRSDLAHLRAHVHELEHACTPPV